MACLYLLLASLVAACTAFTPYGHPCTVSPNGPMVDSLYQQTVNQSCTNGSIYWNYPRGALKVTFQPQGSPEFTTCVWQSLGPPVSAIYQVTDQQNRLLRNPTKTGERDCVKSVNGKVAIRFEAPRFQTYVTVYDYVITRT